jgi:hypothetical protein
MGARAGDVACGVDEAEVKASSRVLVRERVVGEKAR